MSLPWLKENETGIICLRPLTCSRVDNSYLVQHRSKLYCAKTFVPDKNSSWVQCTSNKQACIRENLLYFCQTRFLYWQWNLYKWTPKEHFPVSTKKRGMCLTLISRMTDGILKSASNYWVCGQYPTAQPFKSVKSFSAILSNLDLGHFSERKG